MDDPGVELEWKGFSLTTGKVFHSLFEDEHLTDVTLVCEENAKIEAHKVILSSCSEFFAKILKQNPHPHPLVYLQGVRFKDLELLKQFMYLGSAKVHFDEIQSFMDLSQRFLNQHSEEVPSKALESVKQEECDDTPLSAGTTNQWKTKTGEHEKGFLNINSQKGQATIETTVLAELSQFFPEDKPLACEKCDFKCASKKLLSKHMYNKHSPVPCTEPGCDQVLRNKGILKEHINNKHLDKPKKYLCDECDYSSKWFSCLQIHKRRHTGNLIQCPHCDYRCPKKHLLEIHLDSMHNSNEYNCDKCDTKTRTKRMLKFHKKKVHEGLRYFCDQCDHQASSSYNLKAHQRRRHEKRK